MEATRRSVGGSSRIYLTDASTAKDAPHLRLFVVAQRRLGKLGLPGRRATPTLACSLRPNAPTTSTRRSGCRRRATNRTARSATCAVTRSSSAITFDYSRCVRHRPALSRDLISLSPGSMRLVRCLHWQGGADERLERQHAPTCAGRRAAARVTAHELSVEPGMRQPCGLSAIGLQYFCSSSGSSLGQTPQTLFPGTA